MPASDERVAALVAERDELVTERDELVTERNALAAALSHEQAFSRSLEQQMLLASSQAAARRSRMIVSGGLVSLGTMGTLISIPIAELGLFGVLPWGSDIPAHAAACVSLIVLLAAAMPIDTRMIRFSVGFTIQVAVAVLMIGRLTFEL